MFLIRDLRHAYGLDDVLQIRDWQAEQGEHWLVIGASGSGKTTLLHILAGLLRPTFGKVVVAGHPLPRLKTRALDRFRGRHIGIVLQRLHLIDSLTIEDNLLLAQYFASLPSDRDRVREVLDTLELGRYARRYPHELSFGQAQRAAVARAVVNRPTLVLADEPTSNLDDAHAQRTIELIESQASACRATLLIATHDARIQSRFRNHFRLGSVA